MTGIMAPTDSKKGVKKTRDCSPGQAGKEGPHLTMTGGFSSVQSLSHIQLFATPWTAACQANFLEEISSLSHSIVFLYFSALITEKGFLSNPKR